MTYIELDDVEFLAELCMFAGLFIFCCCQICFYVSKKKKETIRNKKNLLRIHGCPKYSSPRHILPRINRLHNPHLEYKAKCRRGCQIHNRTKHTADQVIGTSV